MIAALEGGEWSAARPGRTLPPGKTRYQLCRRLGGLRGRSVGKSRPHRDSIPDRPAVVSRYTDGVTRPTQYNRAMLFIFPWSRKKKV